jgi:uncharacterized protein YkwD
MIRYGTGTMSNVLRGLHIFVLYRTASAVFAVCVLTAVLLIPIRAHAAGVDFDASTLALLTNSVRASYGLETLAEDVLLDAAAQLKANDMASRGYFAHVSPLGVSPWSWFASVGYFYMYAGENLAVRFDDPVNVVAAWLVSPMHRANILRSSYTQMGIGVARGMYQGEEATFVVQFFGRPSAGITSVDGISDNPVAEDSMSAADL